MRLVLAVAALTLLPAASPAQQEPDWSKIEIKSEKVAGNVYMLYGVGGFSGGNIGVSVGADGIVLVDDEFEPLVPRIEAALKGLSVSDKPVRFVLNTHVHGDHTHGNKAFGLKSTIIAHDNVRRRMMDDDQFDGKPGTRAPAHALPLVTFDHEVAVHLNGEEVRGIHLPAGHTDGDTVVWFTKSNVVHMGDDFFNGMFPFIDLASGGSVDGYVAAVEKVLGQLPADVKIIPGHGPLGTRADLERYLAMLKDTTAVVRKGMAAGKTASQLKSEKALAAWEKWSWDFANTDKFIDLSSGGSVDGYVAAVEKVLGQLSGDVKIIPGHGPVGTRADLERYLAMLKGTTAVVRKGMAAGKTAAQLKAEKALAEWDKWSWEFISTDGMIDQLYNGMAPAGKS
jgi:glyoxylase-like metal-dependent hydrolase (beta-lactamase superfamily II)